MRQPAGKREMTAVAAKAAAKAMVTGNSMRSHHGTWQMTMRPTGNPKDALGVAATVDALDGALSPATLGRLKTMQRSQRMI